MLDSARIVSVPIRGLFNLTVWLIRIVDCKYQPVSVPIRGLFNLTINVKIITKQGYKNKFPSPSGDYLI